MTAVYPGLSGKRLALMTALITRDSNEPPSQAVQRMIRLWNESHRVAEPKEYARWELESLPSEVPFGVVAERQLLPVLSGTATVTSGKGVAKVFRSYLACVAKAAPKLPERYHISSEDAEQWAARLLTRCRTLQNSGTVPREMINPLRRYQARTRDAGYGLTLDDFRCFAPIPSGLRPKLEL